MTKEANTESLSVHKNNSMDMIDGSTAKSTESNISILATTGQSFYYDYSELYRWIVVGSVVVLTMFVGPPFMNWPPIQLMLENAGLYHYLCTDGTDKVCHLQNQAIENLGGSCLSIYFAFALVCGIILDCLGSKICSIIGLACNAIGWIIVGISGSNVAGNRLGMILISISIDCVFFGIMSVSNLFPGNSSFILSLMGAARSISFAIPIAMKELVINANWSFLTVCLIQSGVMITLLILVAIFIPFRSYPKLPLGDKLNYTPGSNIVSLKEYVNQSPHLSWELFKRECKRQYKRQTRYVYRIDFFIFVFVICIALLRNIYYIETAKAHLPDVMSFFETVSPLSFIPCPFLGFVADKLSAALVCGIIALSGVLSLICAMIGGLTLQYMSVGFNWLYISFTASQCYCYISYIYTQQDLGKLTGVCFLIAGLVSLLSSPMNNFSKRGPTEYLAMDLTIIGLGVCSVITTVGLFVFLERPLRNRAKQRQLERQVEQQSA